MYEIIFNYGHRSAKNYGHYKIEKPNDPNRVVQIPREKSQLYNNSQSNKQKNSYDKIITTTRL